jgi:ATP-dependent DNA ligase
MGRRHNPDFHRLGRRTLHGDRSIPVTFMAFDVLALDGEPTLRLPYTERHALLEESVPGRAAGVGRGCWVVRGRIGAV